MYGSTSGEYCLLCWLARFSLVMTRSMTSSMVRGWSAGLRIFSLPSVRQTEFNPHARRKIRRLAFAPCRLEFNLLRRASRGFIETMAQTAHDAVYLDGAVRQEHHFKNNVTFYS